MRNQYCNVQLWLYFLSLTVCHEKATLIVDESPYNIAGFVGPITTSTDPEHKDIYGVESDRIYEQTDSNLLTVSVL